MLLSRRGITLKSANYMLTEKELWFVQSRKAFTSHGEIKERGDGDKDLQGLGQCDLAWILVRLHRWWWRPGAKVWSLHNDRRACTLHNYKGACTRCSSDDRVSGVCSCSATGGSARHTIFPSLWTSSCRYPCHRVKWYEMPLIISAVVHSAQQLEEWAVRHLRRGRSQILRRSVRLHSGQCGSSWALTGEVFFVLFLEISTYIQSTKSANWNRLKGESTTLFCNFDQEGCHKF